MPLTHDQKQEAKQAAYSIHRTMRQHGYGLGEIGYYLKEHEKNDAEDYGAPVAAEMRSQTERILEMLDNDEI